MTHITTVEMSTETGATAVIEIEVDETRDTHTITFSGEVLDLSPEALTASVQMALLTVRDFRLIGSTKPKGCCDCAQCVSSRRRP